MLQAGGLLAGVVSLIMTFGGSARAEPSPFTMANYPVQAEAKDAVTAKKIALDDGQAAAFQSLLKRIVPVTAYSTLDRVKSAQAARYIAGTSVRSEQNSSTAYYATLDFAFSPDAVRDLLAREGVPFVDTQAALVTLVPVTLTEAGVAPVQGPGQWGGIWSGLDLVNTLTPLRIGTPKPGIGSDTLQQLEQGAGPALSSLAAEYGSERVVVAIAKVDTAGGRLQVTLSGQDAVGPIVWTHTYRNNDGDVAYAMEYAAVVSLGVLEGRWKTVQARDMGGLDVVAGPSAPLRIEVLFDSAAEWYRLQQMISGRPGVQDFQVGSVSPRRAEVSLRYPGGGQQLANGLARQGISLTNSNGRWVLRESY
jgi:hypothetical protein